VEQSTIIAVLIAAAVVGLVATLAILRRDRRATEEAGRERTFGVSTEGLARCPSCGFSTGATDTTCASCGRALPR